MLLLRISSLKTSEDIFIGSQNVSYMNTCLVHTRDADTELLLTPVRGNKRYLFPVLLPAPGLFFLAGMRWEDEG